MRETRHRRSTKIVENLADWEPKSAVPLHWDLVFHGKFTQGRASRCRRKRRIDHQQLDIPVQTAYGTTFSPFLQAGAGAMRYDITQSLVSISATNFAWNAGVGADIAVGRNVGLRLMAKDYIGKFDFQEATSFDIGGEGTTNNFAFSAGLRFSF